MILKCLAPSFENLDQYSEGLVVFPIFLKILLYGVLESVVQVEVVTHGAFVRIDFLDEVRKLVSVEIGLQDGRVFRKNSKMMKLRLVELPDLLLVFHVNMKQSLSQVLDSRPTRTHFALVRLVVTQS